MGASVNIQDDETLDADDVALVFQLTGIQLNVGDSVDVGTGASEIGDGSIDWELTYVSFDDTLYDNTDYRPNPPARSEVDLVVFSVSEDDGGTEVFAVVPEPAPGAATTAVLLVLFGLGARPAHRGSA